MLYIWDRWVMIKNEQANMWSSQESLRVLEKTSFLTCILSSRLLYCEEEEVSSSQSLKAVRTEPTLEQLKILSAPHCVCKCTYSIYTSSYSLSLWVIFKTLKVYCEGTEVHSKKDTFINNLIIVKLQQLYFFPMY